jgi:hypothetical protein
MQSRMYKLLSTTYILHLEGASELEFIDYIDDENVKCACGQKLHIANCYYLLLPTTTYYYLLLPITTYYYP